MGYRHTRSEILDAAVGVARESGMAAVTFGTVAHRLGVADRTVVYYFPSKPVLVTAVVERLGADLQDLLERAFGDAPLARGELLARAWPVLASREADPAFRAFFEMVGLAASGTEPYATLAPAVMAGWVDWLSPRVRAATTGERRTEAMAVMALVDGLLLLRATAGPRAASRAARAWGVASSG